MQSWRFRLSHWFRSKRTDRLVTRLIREERAMSSHEAGRAMLEVLCQCLDIERFQRFGLSDSFGFDIRPFYATIGQYCDELKAINARLATGTPLPPQWAMLDGNATTLDRFFESKEGFYINVPEHLARFKNEILILCTLMRESDGAETGIHQYNLRMLTRVFVNLRRLVIVLIGMSHEIGR
ncbi:hypothetical protein HDG34_003225 [Paraburkholderia sp. HC6.4b]|uniref:hypothetical protein n=1 Tax=unclassified Paraburkholderia TaxID=2615204 RepID=UPI00160F9BF0|nr:MULTISPECIES: hypothetical protein [unclassified Paraburkholderia]MBB5409284.1 hypothetical protein [Paraburkholderia sp. HC6.4b]MBB5451012.1 hypothetical protein [Paraburkholderia sp. Kb1A]